ncbi:phenylalanine 4-monooxygenase [Robiginitomaculum antarcticum]|uniref:phenylalanine 4-monooxygenase n=1 Tax=Robiginitomaculum antarcticum TaxID=437507 RepID=UPI00039B2B68|nr:phenylalanine 4-monooxygenase [Robiginitomaculum antarcticum]
MPLNDAVIKRQTPRDDFTIDQCWDEYSRSEHAVWSMLYERQAQALKGRACDEFFEGLDHLDLNDGGIPDLEKLNKKLHALTGWEVVMVPHLVPDDVFFTHLANRRFPAGRFIRGADQMDYLEEPDIFHDVYGHVPMLTQPVFADYMQAYGKGGLRALKHDCLKNLARLYWYTVEFGLIKTDAGMRIYGAGIVSSRTESVFSLESGSPNRLHFDLERVMHTDYRIDDFQQVYFAIDSFDELFAATQQDFGPLYERMSTDKQMHSVTDILPADKVYNRGTQDYAKSGGRKANQK